VILPPPLLSGRTGHGQETRFDLTLEDVQLGLERKESILPEAQPFGIPSRSGRVAADALELLDFVVQDQIALNLARADRTGRWKQ
jgi:hypothetical protein